MIGAVLLLAVLATLGFGVYRLATPGPAGAGRAPGDLRQQVVRFFRLGLLLAAVVLLTQGVAGLVANAVPLEGELDRDPAALAQPLAFTLVGLPVLLGLASWQRRVLSRDDDELRSDGWSAYLTLVLGASLLVTVFAADQTLSWLAGAADRDPGSIGRLVPWAVVLVLHWILITRRPAPVEAPLHLLFGSAVGLILTATGVSRVLGTAAGRAYDRRWTTVVVDTGADPLRGALVLAALGALVWWWYWFRHASAYGRSPGRDAFVLLGGVLGGLIAAVVSAARVFYAVLVWFAGDPGREGAVAHFASVPAAMAIAVVGVLVWWYHRGVVSREVHDHRGRRREIDRVYSYLGSAVGVVTVAVAVTLVVVAVFDAASVRSGLLGDSDVANTTVLAITLLVVGLPVWQLFWRTCRRFATDPAELHAVSRRVYLLLLLGVSAAVALVALVVLFSQFFEDLTVGEVGRDTLHTIRVEAGLVLAAGTVSAYHGTVFRSDRRALAALPAAAGPEPGLPTGGGPVAPVDHRAAARTALREVILLSDAADRAEVAEALEAQLHTRVRCWHLAGPSPDGEAVPALDAAASATPASPVPPAADPAATAAALAEQVRAGAGSGHQRVLVVQRAGDPVELLPIMAD